MLMLDRRMLLRAGTAAAGAAALAPTVWLDKNALAHGFDRYPLESVT
jgi:hypothetical protein